MTAANKTVRMLTRYKAWGNELIFSMLKDMPYEEVVRPRQTRFGNMVHTLNHIYVIDAVFQAHLQGREHGYAARNTPSHPSLEDLWQAVRTRVYRPTISTGQFTSSLLAAARAS
jgi:uncharacterized damage-inducible protein DinB